METHGYSSDVVRYFAAPVNVGPLPDGTGTAVRGEAGSPEDGAWIVLEARIEGQRISAMAFRAYGCPHTIAACCRVTENMTGCDVGVLAELDLDEMRDSLGIPLEKLGRVLILEDAMRGCLAAWQGEDTKRAG